MFYWRLAWVVCEAVNEVTVNKISKRSLTVLYSINFTSHLVLKHWTMYIVFIHEILRYYVEQWQIEDYLNVGYWVVM